MLLMHITTKIAVLIKSKITIYLISSWNALRYVILH